MNKLYLHVSLSVLAASLGASAAFAQDAAPAADAVDQGFGEILVTAQRRSELARDVPISITALSGDTLSDQGIHDTVSLSNVTPGLRMDRIGNFTIPAIRGITSTITGPGADNNVAIYLDGVYQPEATVNNFDLPDVERVEVLKGPQGTLFGRNATGGAIQVFTKMPGDETTGNMTLSYGRFNDLQAKGFIATPLIEGKAAVSVATSYRKSDAYYRNIANGGKRPEGIDSKVLRAKLLLTPSDGLKILLTGLYSDHSDPSGNLGIPLNGNTSARALDPNAIIPTKAWTYASEADIYQRSKVYSLSGKIEAEIGGGTLTSLTSYSEFLNYSLLDADYAAETNGTKLNYAADSTNRSFTEELTYASQSDGPFNYSFGAFYIDGWAGWSPLQLQTPAFTANIWGKQNYTSYAGFGELYYDLSDKISVIVGGRYSHEKRDLSSTIDFTLAPNPALNFVGKKSWSSFTPRVSLKYDLNDRSNVYFSWSRGFKSGVFDATALSTQAGGILPLANPETLDQYELGYKGRVTDWLNLNAAIFYDDYKDIQLVFFVDGIGGLPQAQLGNAGGATIKGAELDANIRFDRHFDARLGVSLLDTKYKGFDSATVANPITAELDPVTGLPTGNNGPCNVGPVTNTGNNDCSFNATGKTMLKAPKFTLFTSATYHADLGGGTLDIGGTAYHSSSIKYTFDGRISQKSWETYDARIAWTPESDKFTISANGRNLGNAKVISGTFIQSAADGVSLHPPRTWSVQLDVRF